MTRGRLAALVGMCALCATLMGPQCTPVGTVYTLEEGSFLLTGCIGSWRASFTTNPDLWCNQL